MAKKYFILSCDGGGIRGLLTALLIKELDFSTGFLKKVDLFAGTSTGGIIALGLAGKIEIGKLIDLYKTKAEKIFKESPLPATDRIARTFLAQAFDKFVKARFGDVDLTGTSPERLFAVKYTNEGLLNEVKEIFPTNPLLSLFERKVLVTTFALNTPDKIWQPVVLHNLEPAKDEKAIKTHVVEAAMCTSAAPTYFEPYKHGTLGYCVDGGVFANNPGSLALSTVIKQGQDISSVSLLSIGTGGLAARLPLESLLIPPGYMGIFPWMFPKPIPLLKVPETPLLALILDGSSAVDTSICDSLLGKRYQRVQVPLKNNIDMDDVKSIDKIEEHAKDFVKTNRWEKIVEWTKAQLQE